MRRWNLWRWQQLRWQRLRWGLLPVLALVLAGCTDVPYLAQAAWGQVSLLSSARPVVDVLADPQTAPEVRRKLQLAQEVRAFALGELGLPDQPAFTTYVQLGRANVSYSVVAAPEFSLQQRTWCFPIAGCVTYRGYFNEAAARAYAERLRAQGDDVEVQGVPAYSTLGYLPDPLLSTTIEGSSDLGLVRLMIHELSHAAVYAPGDTTFNESFATAVELEGTRRWLTRGETPTRAEIPDRAQAAAQEFEQEFEQERQLACDLSAARATARTALGALYARTDLPAEAMRREKAQIFEALRTQLNSALARRGFTGRWPAGSLNNANLGQAGAYSTLVPDFQALLRAKGGDLSAFLAAAKVCAAQPPAQRVACLRQP